MKQLKAMADDPSLHDAFLKAKREAKSQFVDWLKRTAGQTIDPDSIFDSQIKRIHEYKRQMLNALRIVVLYNRLRENPNLDMRRELSFSRAKPRPLTISLKSSSSSSTISPARLMPIPIRGRLRFYSCRIIAFHWRSG